MEEPRKKAEDDDDDSLSSVVVNDPHQTSNDKNNEKEDMALQGDKGKQQTKRFNQVLILKSHLISLPYPVDTSSNEGKNGGANFVGKLAQTLSNSSPAGSRSSTQAKPILLSTSASSPQVSVTRLSSDLALNLVTLLPALNFSPPQIDR